MAMLSIPGIDIDTGIKRCGGNQSLYLRFLKSFAQDPSYASLKNALRQGRPAEAFRHAHTLKGLTAQLSIIGLTEPYANLCKILKAREENTCCKAQEAFDAIAPIHDRLIAELLRLL